MSKMFEDKDGNKSSKRIIGASILTSGAFLLLAVGIASIFIVIKDPGTALDSGKALIIAGSTLITAGVLDGIGQKVGGNK